MQKAKFKLLKNIGIAIVCICIVSYAVYHVSSFFAEEIGTIVVGPTEEKSSVTLGGYIFRDSEFVGSNYGGAIDYAVENGEKVAVRDKLATVYSDGNSVSERESLSFLDEQIAILKKTTDGKPSVSELAKLRQNASSVYYSLMKQTVSGNVSGLETDQIKLLTLINSIAMLSEEDFDINATLASLVNMRAELLAAGGDSEEIRAPRSGYFYADINGYEKAFTGKAAMELDGDGFSDLFDSGGFDEQSLELIGKMSYDSKWYFVSGIRKSVASGFELLKKYPIEFTSGGYFEIDMTLVRTVEDADADKVYLVFETNVLPDGFKFEHRQTARVVTETIRGIYVPMTAIRRENFERVVYIVNGSVVQMRHIDIVYEGADYYIVRESVEASDGKEYLESNDQLIVSGSNLFHGRILD